MVASDEDAIGYSVHYYVTTLMPVLGASTRPIAIGGFDPTRETIASRAYPLTTESWVVVRSDERAGTKVPCCAIGSSRPTDSGSWR